MLPTGENDDIKRGVQSLLNKARRERASTS